jgi:hypothetical protein
MWSSSIRGPREPVFGSGCDGSGMSVSSSNSSTIAALRDILCCTVTTRTIAVIVARDKMPGVEEHLSARECLHDGLPFHSTYISFCSPTLTTYFIRILPSCWRSYLVLEQVYRLRKALSTSLLPIHSNGRMSCTLLSICL